MKRIPGAPLSPGRRRGSQWAVRRRGRIGAGPLLTRFCGLEQRQAFSTSLAVILPLCILSAAVYLFRGGLDLLAALPYLIGGTVGGWLGGRWFRGCGWCGSGVPSGFCCCMGSEVPAVSEWVLPLLAGGAAGVLSGFGVGAGRCFWCI